MSGSPVTISASGATTVYTPSSGKRVRLYWVGLSSPSSNTGTVTATVSLGGSAIYVWDMGAPGAFAHKSVREGPADGTITVTLSGSQTVHVNLDLEDF